MRFPFRTLAAASTLAAAVTLTACGGSDNDDDTTEVETPPGIAALDASSAARCDHTNTTHCLYPFPNNHFTQADTTTPTGLRIAFDEASMPVAEALDLDPVPGLLPAGLETDGGAIDPTEWNRNDGFSPGSMLLAHVPGVDLERSDAAPLTDPQRSLYADAPILVIDAETGERHPVWAELDANVSDPAEQALIIRPARNFLEGHRYIVALRDLVDGSGEAIEASVLFRAYRDGTATGVDAFEERRPEMEAMFQTLEANGVDRDDLFLAWDFTVASQQSITERLLHIRDQAFARLGGGAPQFTINRVEDAPEPGLSREITGTFEVPNYLNQAGGPPGSSFNYASDDPDALPTQLGDDTVTARYRCQIPETAVSDFSDSGATVTPARAALYGHGLFGQGPGGEFHSADVRNMQSEHNVLFCATDWIGMAYDDIANGVIFDILADISLIPQQLDRSQQGLLNFMYLAELLRHPDGFASDPAFQHNGTVVFDGSEVFYDGNSQGGIMGGALVATAPNIDRGVLGVPGANYSLLLRRYGTFQQSFGVVLNAAYPDGLDRTLDLALMQMLWDRAENNGYLSHLAGNHLPNTPTDKTVLMHVALGDHQVTHWSAEIMARTIGASIHEPTKRLGESQLENPYFGIPAITQYPHQGHALMVWDTGDYNGTDAGTPFPPLTNTGPSAGADPHESPRDTVAARQQKSDFLQTGGAVTDVCGATPCYTHDYTGLSRFD